MSPTQPDSAPPTPSDDDQAQRWLAVLRDGDDGEKLVARSALARLFERRGMLPEATELLETNARFGDDDGDLHVRLASLYRRQGRPDLAQQAIARAAALANPPRIGAPVDSPPAPPSPAAIARPGQPQRRRSVLPLLLGGLGGLAIVGLGFYAWANWSCGDCTDPEARIAALDVPTPALAAVAPSSTPVAPTAIRATSTGSGPAQPPTTPATALAFQALLSSPAPLASPAASSEPSPAPSPAAPPATPTDVARAGPQGPNCPPDRPIKGNQGSRSTTEWIYHVPAGRFYAVTVPEECFATEAEAQRAGYRRSLR